MRLMRYWNRLGWNKKNKVGTMFVNAGGDAMSMIQFNRGESQRKKGAKALETIALVLEMLPETNANRESIELLREALGE